MHRVLNERLAQMLCATAVLLVPRAGVAEAEANSEQIGRMVVVAPYGDRVSDDKVAASVQTATAEDIERAQTLDLTDLLNRNFASVSINHAQNNPLQPDVNFRGFTASPLLGLPQGLTVYQNGMRLNEPFGDTVNWDLVPLSAVNEVQLLAGPNPVFGLNTLGGALSLQMKNGFNYKGTGAEAYGGSFGRKVASLQSGGNDGTWGYYGDVDWFDEDGWRDFSKSHALRFFGTLSARTADSTADLSLAHANTWLRGNGATPVELLAIDRRQGFTYDDITDNRLSQAILEGTHRFSDAVQVAGNAFYRKLDTDTFNGDGTTFEECDVGGEELLVEDEFTDVNGDGECSDADDTDIMPVLDVNGDPIAAELDGEPLDAINNLGHRAQKAYGASAQVSLHSSLGSRSNDLVLGTGLNEGRATFHSDVEVAALLADRFTSHPGIFAADFVTGVRSEIETASLYLADVLQLSDAATLTLAGRYDRTRIELSDLSGESPELAGKHTFDRVNPAVGLTYRVSPALLVYGNVSQSGRAPTPVELACASEDAPCNLPNAFLADPPLDEVVTLSEEIGLRGSTDGGLRWQASAFNTVNKDDIIFQSTGGATGNVGFFDNVSDTRRLGVELSLEQQVSRLTWSLKYTYLSATFEDDFIVNSPNHPVFEDDPGAPEIVGDGQLLVKSGSEIPGVPQHQANVDVDYAFNERWSIGADVELRSGVLLRGDEANLLDRTDGYAVVNLRSDFNFNEQFAVFARIENVFDQDYETFGILGEPEEVFPTFQDARFLGAGPPRGAWVGFRLKL